MIPFGNTWDEILKDEFTEPYYLKLREFLKSENKQDEFFRQWVLNESYLKWTGDGLTKDLRVLKREGWYQFLHFHRNYLCAIWSEKPMNIEIREI